MRISDWSSDVCSSDLLRDRDEQRAGGDVARLRLPAAFQRQALVAFDRLRIERGFVRAERLDLRRGQGGVQPAELDPVQRQLPADPGRVRSEEHTSELQSLMRISYAAFCLKKKKQKY